MKFETKTGSLYEVDPSAKKIRRLNGKKDPQPRQGKDGEWKEYADIDAVVGCAGIIVWPSGTPLLKGSPDSAVPMTITSKIVSITY